jgi:cephalosporin hydroxylase
LNSSSEIVQDFHRLYYEAGVQARTEWLGVRARKCPLDLWIYQEILFEKRPDLIVETGTADGGSAYFLATICDLIGSGRIVTVDIRPREGRPEHSRISYLQGDSAAPEAVNAVREQVNPDESVMVILDSDHGCDHVLAELGAYGPLVTPGQYLIVEDTNVNGNPVRPEHGPGPMEAVAAFLQEELGRRFAVDPAREKFFLTFNPGGYLIRTAEPG